MAFGGTRTAGFDFNCSKNKGATDKKSVALKMSSDL
jgi:hypothetical protein